MFDPNKCIYSDQQNISNEVKEENPIFLSQPDNLSIPEDDKSPKFINENIKDPQDQEMNQNNLKLSTSSSKSSFVNSNIANKRSPNIVQPKLSQTQPISRRITNNNSNVVLKKNKSN